MPDRREFLGAVAGLAAGAVLAPACDCCSIEPCIDFEIVEVYSLAVDTEERTERLSESLGRHA